MRRELFLGSIGDKTVYSDCAYVLFGGMAGVISCHGTLREANEAFTHFLGEQLLETDADLPSVFHWNEGEWQPVRTAVPRTSVP